MTAPVLASEWSAIANSINHVPKREKRSTGFSKSHDPNHFGIYGREQSHHYAATIDKTAAT